MPTIRDIRHRTTYRYRRPVRFGEHRAMFRPRDSHDVRILDTGLTTSPRARTRWLHDCFGNSIAVMEFADAAAELSIESRIKVKTYAVEGMSPSISAYARTYPFAYDVAELPDLARLIERHHPDPRHAVDAWARDLLAGRSRTDTEDLLVRMTRAVRERFVYLEREEEGTQTPAETLAKGSGSCRDLALFMMEAARVLGIAARFVSGYLYDPSIDRGAGAAMVGAGATHAWVQLYLPGAGWVEFDPTNGLMGGPNLIRVAVAREPSQAVPLAGSYVGARDDFLSLDVRVEVRASEPEELNPTP